MDTWQNNLTPKRLYDMATNDIGRANKELGLGDFVLYGPHHVVKRAPAICMRRGYQAFKEGYVASLAHLRRHVDFVGIDPSWRLEFVWYISADNPWMDYAWHQIVCYEKYIRDYPANCLTQR